MNVPVAVDPLLKLKHTLKSVVFSGQQSRQGKKLVCLLSDHFVLVGNLKLHIFQRLVTHMVHVSDQLCPLVANLAFNLMLSIL